MPKKKTPGEAIAAANKWLGRSDQESAAAFDDAYASGVSSPDAQMKRLVDLAEETQAENVKTVDAQVKPELNSLRHRADDAETADRFALGERKGLTGDMSALYDDLVKQQTANQQGANSATQGALSGYMDATDPLLAMIQAGGYVGDAKSNAADVARQQGVFDQLQTLSNPQVTGQERYLMELARGQQEQQERSSRDAVMGDLSARGMAGSGAQLTNMLGASQQNSQNRLLADLGTQANAVNRSMTATGMAGDVAGQMRTSGDVMARANQQLKQLQSQHMDRFAQLESERVAGLAGEQNTAQGKAADDMYRRTAETLSTREGAGRAKYDMGMGDVEAGANIERDAYGRQGDIFNAASGYAGQRAGINSLGAGMVQDAGKARVGNLQAEAAARAAEKPRGILDWAWQKIGL